MRLLGISLGVIAIANILFTLAFPAYGTDTLIHIGAWRGIFAQKYVLARAFVFGAVVFLLLSVGQFQY
ncbi:hypothetical protein [Myxacorys almedinensis]|uniref:Uncharacterized protein n=1 Tax=Myxacorys almedinensis A TaxID=2690445 RepID=A0A8J7Z6K1_9CYAN|nr:hypothetical protein [Myxacorys almedinensis]NDJ18836.1 hypothetical protein [Myxacorys almedinensis A]